MSAPTGKKLDVKVLRFLVFTSRARLIPLTQVALDIVCRVAPPRLAVQNRRARFANSRRRLLTKRAALGSYSNGAGDRRFHLAWLWQASRGRAEKRRS